MIAIPGYSIGGEIGRGGMAAVYRARQVLLDREVALKVLNPPLAQDPVYAQRFLQEARMLASLAHPHIVPVYDVGVTPDGLNYFSMQLVGGGDFGRKLREGIDEVELVRVLVAVAQALGFAHARGYVHRDVTPANILFDQDNRAILTDFGIARALAATSRITATGLSIGTSHYMSPEQARGQEVDRRSDIYSLGVLLYEALVGTPPFEGDDGFAVAYAHVHQPVPRLPEGLERWQPVVDRAMAKLPEQRYSDCEAFIAGLRQAAPSEYARAVGRDKAAPLPPPAARNEAGPPPAPAVRVQPVPAPASPLTIKVALQQPSRLPLYLAGGILALSLGSAAIWWGMRGEVPAGSKTTPARTAEAPPPSPAAKPAPVPLAADDRSVAEPDAGLSSIDQINADIATAQAIALGEVPTVEDPVEKLLALGRANLAAQRLSTPPVNNAVDRFRLALRIEPENAPAKVGLGAVAQAYVDLAGKQDPEAALEPWLDLLSKAEALAQEFGAAAPLASAQALRQTYADDLLQRGASAITAWQRDQAIALHQRALRVLPASEAAQRGLRAAEGVGRPGYVFRDGDAKNAGPEMVVVGGFALARRETSVGEFRAYWRAAGQSKFGAALPSCRDRESVFRSSRKRSWQEPGHNQGDTHPVVCVNYAMAEDYARWLSIHTGKRYRLPTASEWRSAGSVEIAAGCSANLRDASFRDSFGGREGLACSDQFGATAPGGSFAARKPGLYDVDGNVREWVSDCAGGCDDRLALGASWVSQAGDPAAPAFDADTGFNTIGLRVLRELDAATKTRSE